MVFWICFKVIFENFDCRFCFKSLNWEIKNIISVFIIFDPDTDLII
jgi:hypothetical protein